MKELLVLVLVLVLVLGLVCSVSPSEDPDVMSVRPGDDVTLTCRSTDPNIVAVEWTRPDLEPEQVFLYIDGHFKPQKQHPSFMGRVQLVDTDLKDGDASLTLKNVSSSDEGTYECRVRVDDPTRQKRALIDDQPIRRVRLQVTAPGSDYAAMKDGEKEDGEEEDGEEEDGGHTRMHVGVTAAASFLVCLCVGLFVFWKSKRHLNNDPEAAAADGDDDELL
ncbi:coxsackievirus and adenovirus receptor [Larimichthys crocea]|uniref:coxsackievirus and adenovirus receptor n=1 Tax=Larimichthys crocea TaxID=215358 RepID=UPI000900EF28|nr:coxsackievirus and adenovirus receptor [Larimichthys crocea]XP_027143837.1 coxsackievirus and adenovirus receptor [Larimichthys crocea]